MSDGFSVAPAELRSAEANLADLESRAGAIGELLQQALSGIAAAAGEAGLENAVRSIEQTCARLLSELTNIYSYIGTTLVSSASSYDASRSRIMSAGGQS